MNIYEFNVEKKNTYFQANAFYGSSGLSGYIPSVYTQIARNFHKEVCRAGQGRRISLLEYRRPDWNFHGKGVWFYSQGSQFPALTLVGSSNLGKCYTCCLVVVLFILRQLVNLLCIVDFNEPVQFE